MRFALGAILGNDGDIFPEAKRSGCSKEASAAPPREIPELERKVRRDEIGVWKVGQFMSLPLRNGFVQTQDEIRHNRPGC